MVRLFSVCSLFFAAVAYAAPVQYDLDTAKSVIHWKASKVAGPHDGTVMLKSGEVSLDNGVPTAGTFTIDFATITDLDLKDLEWKKKLEDHLKSSDFFDVPKYPTGTFTLKSAKATKSAGVYDVTGDLKIKDKVKSITFPATIVVSNGTATAKAELKINRLDYDIKYNSGRFFDPKKLGDKMIYDDIELKLDLVSVGKGATTATKTKSAPTKK